jgi:hypothetical protein
VVRFDSEIAHCSGWILRSHKTHTETVKQLCRWPVRRACLGEADSPSKSVLFSVSTEHTKYNRQQKSWDCVDLGIASPPDACESDERIAVSVDVA